VLKKATEWENLTKIGRSKVVSLTILVPIFGYLILFNQHLVQLFELSSQIIPSISENRSNAEGQSVISSKTRARLYYFYFGFTFLGIASIIYKVRCPNIIQEYGSSRTYVREEKDMITDNRFYNICSKISEIEKQAPEDLDPIVKGYENGWKVYAEDKGVKKDAAVTDLQFYHWNSANKSRKKSRNTVFYLYIAGFVALAYPSCAMFISVVKEYLSL